jgi:hypothetical protein
MTTDLDPSPQEPEDPEGGGDGEDAEPTERLSWAAYFGGAAGLAAGMMVALFLAASLHWWLEAKRATEIFWSVIGPLLAFLGLIAGSFTFHRLFRGQLWLPLILFITVVGAGVYAVFNFRLLPWVEGP